MAISEFLARMSPTITRGSLAGLRWHIEIYSERGIADPEDLHRLRRIEREWTTLDAQHGQGCMLDIYDRVVQQAARSKTSQLHRNPERLENATKLRAEMGNLWWEQTHSLSTYLRDSH